MQTILVVEDNSMVRDLLAVTLELEYQTLEADNGKLALEMVEQFRPDLILLDVYLPGLSGLEVCAMIRTHPDPGLRRLPVLLLSGGASADEGAVMARAAGANGYLAKPYSPAYLLDRIGAMLEGEKC